MVTGRAPTPLPYPWIDGLTKKQQEQIYLDFQAIANDGAGTRWATVVIAASDSQPINKAGADFVCDGVADDVEINLAISQLMSTRSGEGLGRIVLLEGTFNLAAAIGSTSFSQRHLVIQGMGAAGFDNSTLSATRLVATTTAVVSCIGSGLSVGSAITLMDLGMYNSSVSAATVNMRDITTIVDRCFVKNGSAGAVNIETSLGTEAGSRVMNSTIYAAGSGQGIFADVGTSVDRPFLISGNMIYASIGIECKNNINTVPTYLVTGNYCESTGGTTGIALDGSSTQSCVVEANIVRGYTTGIGLGGSRHLISGNVVDTCTTGISATGLSISNPAILGNQVYNCTTAVAAGGTTPSIIGNKYTACTTGTTINGGTTDAAVFANDTFGCTTALNDSGTNTRTESVWITLSGLPHHATTHETGGVDAITGNMDANARTGVRKNSTGSTFKRRRTNFIEGANITITVADDSADEEVDITIAASTGGGSLSVKKNGSSVGSQSTINIIEGSGITATVTDTGTQIDITLSASTAGAGTATTMFNSLFLR